MNERLRRMLRRLPSWLRFRYDATTIGQKLMEALSLPIVEAEKEISALASEIRLGSATNIRTAWVYRTAIDLPQKGETIIVAGNGFTLEPVDEPLLFLRSLPADPLYDPALHYDNPYLVDYDHSTLYVRKPYAETITEPGGTIQVSYRLGGVERIQTYRLALYHVWNAVDEYALLSSLARQIGETNQTLRQRIWDRFTLPKHDGPSGIASRLAQAIGLMRERQWLTPEVAFTIPEPKIDPHLVLVNGLPLTADQYRIDTGERVVLLPRAEVVALTVRYAAGLRVRPAMANDIAKQRRSVNEVTPTWGYMRFNMTAWAPSDLGSARSPVTYDPDLSVWQ